MVLQKTLNASLARIELRAIFQIFNYNGSILFLFHILNINTSLLINYLVWKLAHKTTTNALIDHSAGSIWMGDMFINTVAMGMVMVVVMSMMMIMAMLMDRLVIIRVN